MGYSLNASPVSAASLSALPQYAAQPQQQMPAPQGNYFDQFDEHVQAPQQPHGQPQQGGNYFDQFDDNTAAQADGAFGSFVKGAMSGATMNFADPILAGAQALVGNPFNAASQADSLGERYHENLKWQRERGEANMQAHPIATLAGNVAGGFALPVGKINSLKSAVKIGGLLGAGYGAGAGVTRDEGIGDTLGQAGIGALTGAATGGVLQGVANKVSSKMLKRPPVSSRAFNTPVQRAYDAAENSGAFIKQSSIQKMAMDLDADLLKGGFAPGLHKAAAEARAVVQQAAGGNMTWNGLRILEDQTGGAVGMAVKNSADDARVTGIVNKHVRNLLDRLDANDLIPGTGNAVDVQAAAKANRLANTLYRAKKNTEFVEGLIDDASVNAAGLTTVAKQNAFVARFRAASKNRNQMRKLPKELQQAIRNVAMGNKTVHAARYLGKFAPSGLHSTTIGIGSGATAGGFIGGPLGAMIGGAAVPVAGKIGETVAKNMTAKAVERALEAAARLPNGMATPRGLHTLTRSQIKALKAARYLPKLAPGAIALTAP